MSRAILSALNALIHQMSQRQVKAWEALPTPQKLVGRLHQACPDLNMLEATRQLYLSFDID